MRNIAIIPARSGSKGLRDKNIKNLNGKPLIAYSIDEAKKSNLFQEIMVSTDSKHYAEISDEYGASVPFLRSEDLSSDTAGSWDVVKSVLNRYKEMGQVFDSVCLLQPTSPLRTFNDIIGAYNLLEEKGAEAVTSVCEVDHSPLWCMVLPENGSLSEYRQKEESNTLRQNLDQYFRENGAIYIRRIRYTEVGAELLEDKEYAFIMERDKSIDIDTELDFIIAEVMQKYSK